MSLLTAALLTVSLTSPAAAPATLHPTSIAPDTLSPFTSTVDRTVRSGTETIDGLEVFFREAGDPALPKLVLLHGFPTSSHMFRELMPRLADRFHTIAPDYPGFGLSDAPPADEFEYTFDRLTHFVDALLTRRGFDRYALYLMDYGAPIGFRLATAHPERVTGLVVQNGNAYEEGLEAFWDPIKQYWASDAPEDRDALRGLLTLDATRWQFRNGTRRPETISPDNWLVVEPLLDRPGNADIQLDLFRDYGTNPPLYPAWQAYLREQQPPTLIVWGRHDEIFPSSGAFPYLRDLPHAELHLLDTGHFVLEEDVDRVAQLIREFFATRG